MLPHIEISLNSILIKNTIITNTLKNYIKPLGTILSLAITSFLFGVLHSDIMAGSIAGLGYGFAYLQRKKLIDAISAHSITNFLLAIDVVYYGNWSYW